MLLVEQNAARTIEIADRTYVMRAAAGSSSTGTRRGARQRGDFETAYIGIERRSRCSSPASRTSSSTRPTPIYYGSFFALISLSLSLLFGVMGLMNFAYGELIMAGAYVMFYTRSWGWLAMVVMVDR